MSVPLKIRRLEAALDGRSWALRLEAILRPIDPKAANVIYKRLEEHRAVRPKDCSKYWPRITADMSPAMLLDHALLWARTPEGDGYWRRLHAQLKGD
jgi:hypothetical protein